MSVYVTGDTHGGFQRLGMKYFPEQKKMNREDMVIIAGDFGGLWGGTPAEKYWLDWLEDKPFTTAFLDGNHENFAMLNALPERLWHGGRIHEVRPHVLHLMRGQVFDIEGYTFFTMGGVLARYSGWHPGPRGTGLRGAVLADAAGQGHVPGQGRVLVDRGTSLR